MLRLRFVPSTLQVRGAVAETRSPQRKLDGATRPRSARGLEEDAAWNAWRDALDAEEHGSWWSKEEEIAAAYEERYAVNKHWDDVGSNEDEAWALQYDYEETR